MADSKLQTSINTFREFVQENGWTIVEEKEIQSGYQITVADGKTRVPAAFYHSGKALIQGKEGELRTRIRAWWYEGKTSSDQPAEAISLQPALVEVPSTTLSPAINTAGVPRIGLDESGKGDYFGPLVIGAVYVDERTENRLLPLGVRDSKLLADNRILALAGEIQALCPHFVVPIEPKRYNELYNKIQHLNRLLAWGHAWTLEQMLEKVSCDLAIIDQFGDKSYILQALREKGRSITIVQRPRAEEDLAVAAASILARAKFVQQLEQLSKHIGKTLPKGASDPAIVTAGRETVATSGKDILTEIAKLHFKTTQTILQAH
ncbi:MAG TPA: ribonuclease HIII [Ktedonobacteraceae bacterium]|nr:ribonuclease HIII [Ktedonobacteraceae bacterium]